MRHFWRDRRSVALIEFAIIAPVFFVFFFAILGAGMDGFYQLVLDDATRNATRQIQIDGPAATSGTAFVATVCAEFVTNTASCNATLTYNVQAIAPYSATAPVSAGWAGLTPVSLPASGKLPNNFPSFSVPGSDNYNVLAQTAYPLPFKLPFVANLITFTGTGSILAAATVRFEPY